MSVHVFQEVNVKIELDVQEIYWWNYCEGEGGREQEKAERAFTL